MRRAGLRQRLRGFHDFAFVHGIGRAQAGELRAGRLEGRDLSSRLLKPSFVMASMPPASKKFLGKGCSRGEFS